MSYRFWFDELEASSHLGVSTKTLTHWRELGFLKEGTHWRVEADCISGQVLYRLSWCQEEMIYWKDHDACIFKNAV